MTRETISETSTQIRQARNSTLRKELQAYISKLNQTNKDALIINKCKAYLVCKSIKSFISADAILKKIDLS